MNKVVSPGADYQCITLPTNRSFKTAYEEVLGRRVSFACLLPGCIIPMTLYARCRNDWGISVFSYVPPPSPTAAKYKHTECTGTETYDRSSALIGYYKEGVKNIPRKLFLLINTITRKGLYEGWISNEDGDGNGNGKKAIGFISAKQQLCSYQVFLYIL